VSLCGGDFLAGFLVAFSFGDIAGEAEVIFLVAEDDVVGDDLDGVGVAVFIAVEGLEA
jgi:hypothetical protein